MDISTNPDEDEYLALVERIQKAMCIEPFRPDVTDVVVLIGTVQVLNQEVERLRRWELDNGMNLEFVSQVILPEYRERGAEVEQLRAELETLQHAHGDVLDALSLRTAEIERLQAVDRNYQASTAELLAEVEHWKWAYEENAKTVERLRQVQTAIKADMELRCLDLEAVVERLRAENKGARRYLAAAIIQAGGELVIEDGALVRVQDETILSRERVLDVPGERFKAY